jgi:CRISPR system Cascade subunit CasB
LAQTEPRLEAIVVDDCSPDACGSIIRDIAARDSRVVYIRHDQNRGCGAARNTALDHARGEFVGSVDSDDYLAPTTFEATVRRCLSDRSDIAVFSGLDYIEADGNLQRRRLYDLDRFPSTLTMNQDALLSLFPSFPLKIYRRELLERYGVRFPEHLYHEDDEFYWKLFGSALPKVSVVNEALYIRTRRKDRTSIMDHTTTSRKDMPQVFLNAMRFLKANGSFPTIRKAFVKRVSGNLYVIHHVLAEHRQSTFETFKTLLEELQPRASEVEDESRFFEMSLIRRGNFADYLNWRLDQLKLNRRQEIEAALREVYESTSWRVTAPLRKLIEMVQVWR